MTIHSEDVRLLKSKVMLDTPEGGGGPTGVPIPDGVSNAIFPDVSEMDRVVGRVNARQVHVHIDTPTLDMYLGSYLAVDKPPTDPAISITMVDTGEMFDTREEAIRRIEAYLTKGTPYAGFLFGNHISGMQTISVLQRTEELHPVGEALVLTRRAGFSDEMVQFVRVIDASATLRTFTDNAGDYQRWEANYTLSDKLRYDFPGFDASRFDFDINATAQKTGIHRTVVANAATYKGASAVDVSANIGDFTLKVESIFSQLVPSAQVETPLADARTNQVSVALVPAGDAVTVSFNAVWTASQALFVGGGIVPASLSATRDGITLTDNGGKLVNGATQVGTVDYENGVLTLSTNVFGAGGGGINVTYRPAATPSGPLQSQGFPITVGNRALNYIRTLVPPPLRGSTRVEYRSQGRWYVLKDDGSGALRGSETAYGAGQVNFTTGTFSVTLGALPDVGSLLIVQWVDPDSEVPNNLLKLANDGKLYWPVNANGVVGDTNADQAISPGGLSVSWVDSSGTRTVTDNSAGVLQGYGTGSVDYARGKIKLSPTTLPPPGTQVTITRDTRARITANPTVSTVGAELHFNLGSGVKPGSVFFHLQGQRKYRYKGGPVNNFGDSATYALFDRGTGKLLMFISARQDFAYVTEVGTINYASGDCVMDISTALTAPEKAIMAAFDNTYVMEPIADNTLINYRQGG